MVTNATSQGVVQPLTPDLWFTQVNDLDLARIKLVKSANAAARSARAGTFGSSANISGSHTASSSRPSSSQSHPSSSQNQQTTGHPRAMLLKLTEDKCSLLMTHQGCFGCRKFYAGHMASDCPSKSSPPPADTPVITSFMAAAAKAAFDRRQGNPPAIPTTNAILVDGTEDYTYPCVLDEYVVPPSPLFPLCTATLSTAPRPPSPLPSSLCAPEPPSPIRARSPSCMDDSPLVVELLLWHAVVDGPGSTHAAAALIDDGSQVVLVRESVVSALGLRRHRLPKPMPIGSAFFSGEGDCMIPTNSSDFSSTSTVSSSATEFVRLCMKSPDGSYTTRSVKAFIVTRLAFPVLLGLPWLIRNDIVISPAHRSCIVRESGYDLMDPDTPAPRPAIPVHFRSASPRHRDSIPRASTMSPDVHALHAAVIEELNSILPPLRAEVARTADHVSPVDLASLLCGHVAIQELAELDAQMKHKNFDLFPADIPHTTRLPTHTYHRIRLKDASATIKARQYSSPRKYRDAWHTLLDGHLAAGRIRPSSSLFASPAFLIPNSMPTLFPTSSPSHALTISLPTA
ncbi:hypothetical protein OF83DRAFT_1180075 [Amylostereum chailletii]|nr:hypothetical protein OF83DRAFT_1180075 [Amylostereum chailletii]